MATHKSAEKRARQSVRKAANNYKVKSSVRTFEKKILTAIAANDGKTAKTLLTEFMSKVDKAAAKGVVHARAASRKVARLSTRIHKISATK